MNLYKNMSGTEDLNHFNNPENGRYCSLNSLEDACLD